jgi:hypothetical protein
MVQAKIGDTVKIRHVGSLEDGSTLATSMHRVTRLSSSLVTGNSFLPSKRLCIG